MTGTATRSLTTINKGGTAVEHALATCQGDRERCKPTLKRDRQPEAHGCSWKPSQVGRGRAGPLPAVLARVPPATDVTHSPRTCVGSRPETRCPAPTLGKTRRSGEPPPWGLGGTGDTGTARAIAATGRCLPHAPCTEPVSYGESSPRSGQATAGHRGQGSQRDVAVESRGSAFRRSTWGQAPPRSLRGTGTPASLAGKRGDCTMGFPPQGHPPKAVSSATGNPTRAPQGTPAACRP